MFLLSAIFPYLGSLLVPRVTLATEILVLRQQLIVLNRTVKRAKSNLRQKAASWPILKSAAYIIAIAELLNGGGFSHSWDGSKCAMGFLQFRQFEVCLPTHWASAGPDPIRSREQNWAGYDLAMGSFMWKAVARLAS